MRDNKDNLKQALRFCGTDENPYPVFSKELTFIRKRREKMGAANRSVKLTVPPTTQNGLVGLCLSGGGIRSATFNLGFLQALYKHGILPRVDYLSTVSGGGYIGSCLTALLDSELSNAGDPEKEPQGPDKGGYTAGCLWTENNFPFSRPKPLKEAANKESREEKCACSLKSGGGSAEKKPTRHLRYFSNYLTAEGDLVRKYIGPVVAVTRGMLFNFLLIVPLIVVAAVLLAMVYQMPVRSIGGIPLYFSLEKLKSGLIEQQRAKAAYTAFVYQHTPDLGTAGISQRAAIIHTKPSLEERERQILGRLAQARSEVHHQWAAMLTIPLATLLLMMGSAFVFMRFFSGTIENRYAFSYVFSTILFISLVLLAIQVFGAVIVYWNHLQIPNKLAFVSLLSIFGPKLMTMAGSAGDEKKPWVKIALSVILMALAPLVLFYVTGWLVYVLLTPFDWSRIIGWGIAGIILLYGTNRWININAISLHHFYRDRLSRAFLIQHDSRSKGTGKPFDRIATKDTIPLSAIYDGDPNVGPYPIINANLNLSKQMPDIKGDGVFRNCESFIFSKYWCGSERTGYIDTSRYEKVDSHLNLGTAMAISGAAANIGMGQGNVPAMRLLMGLLNIRLGYWAPHPDRKFGWATRLFLNNTPGGLLAMREWIGRYPLNGDFINLSDGGHFDNIGVYELLRRRCKYIIVGDAEADSSMKFQALAYIIRLARIDLGIDIDIDTSNIKPGADPTLSPQHCTVGIIHYPGCADGDHEVGYLLYCKSCLTGDEPEHLHEYRVKHPSFPHQSTADQWFDEQQFEVYRELGFHVGDTTFKAVVENKQPAGMEETFTRVREFWRPRTVANDIRFAQHGSELNRIIEIIKNDKNLSFMDGQIFPEWETLMSDAEEKPQVNLWLPSKAEELRAGFYVCNLMMQLMENVYLHLNLESQYDHPDNRGWMNLFKHFSWAGIFQVSWAISACTFGAKFERFCARRLDLDIGRIELVNIWKKEGNAPDTDRRFQTQIDNHLNPYERKKVAEHIAAHKRIPDDAYVFKLVVQSPIETNVKKEFCFGFAFLARSSKRVEIDYFRIQDHLRRMGLGRNALEGLVKTIVQTGVQLKGDRSETAYDQDAIVLADWIEDLEEEQTTKDFKSMLVSVVSKLACIA